MEKTIIVLPDGTEISSGVSTGDAVQSCAYTECVNSGTELTLGSVCAAMIEVKFITPQGGLPINAGDELIVYKDDGKTRRKLGIFIAEKPARPSAHTMSITAYDRVCLLDRDLTGWVASLTGWPYSLYDFAAMVCAECGLELVNMSLPNGGYQVQKFTAQGITGRKLLEWVAQAAGHFCRATADGALEFAWYTPAQQKIGVTPASVELGYEGGVLSVTDSTLTVTAGGDTVQLLSDSLAVTGEAGGVVTALWQAQHYYFQGGLSYEGYATDPIEKVQIGQTADDVGVVWPATPEPVNTYKIVGNGLLTDQSVERLLPVAQTLYEQLQGFSYTPCKVSIPATQRIRAGHSLTVTDKNGKSFTMLVMTKKQTGQKMTLECTGSKSRDSVAAVNAQSYAALAGKILELRTDVEGIRAENKAADGRMASLSLTVEGIATQVQQQSADTDALQTALTTIQQTAGEVQIAVQTIRDQGAEQVKTRQGYTFNDSGLQISRDGEPLSNQLSHEGMVVKRNGSEILKADHTGVLAVDVSVGNFLIVGENARFEDYEYGRTACFYL